MRGSYLRVRVKDGEEEWQPFDVEEEGRSYHQPSEQEDVRKRAHRQSQPEGVGARNHKEPEQEREQVGQEEEGQVGAGTPVM